MLVDVNQENEIRVATVENEDLLDFESESLKNERVKGNIYLAKIIRVEPSLQAAFVDYGAKKHGFLAYNEIHPDYFKIPTADKKKLLEQEIEESQNIQINEENDNFLGESFAAQEQEKTENTTSQKSDGFLSKIFDFFNYKPIDDFSHPRLKRKKNFKPPKKNRPIIFHRKYSIQEVIKSNQVILIQVVKEERGNKGAAVTTRLSLAGKYCVLMPNTNKGGGISRKIIDIKHRKKLKDIVSKLKIKDGMGVIIRTAGQVMGLAEIKRDYNSLIKLWKEITSKTIKSSAPCLIHEEDNLIKRWLRDYFDSSYENVLVNNNNMITKCKKIVKQFMPSSVRLIKLYKDKKPLFSSYGIEKKIMDINNPIVNLKSGGYLVINQTEALVAIDINSGKFTKNRNIEDTAFQTNLEAAEEISKQIKIRDLAGLIVIDFIDMLERNHNFKVEKRFKEFLKNDRARIQIGRISNFGLLELSRQRLKVTEDSKKSKKCSLCDGYGSTPTSDFLVSQILKVFTEISYEKPKEKLFLLCNEFLKNEIIQRFDKKKVSIFIDNNLHNIDFLIYKKNQILYKNFNREIEIEVLNRIINQKPLDQKKENNEKKLDISNESLINNQPEAQSEDIKKVLNEKRKSYRQKAVDLSKKKSGYKVKKKIAKTSQNIDAIKSQENSEKRQGWWNQ